MDDKMKAVVERVRKLLALAGNNPNENEAALAAAKAHAILAEHNLAMSDIDVANKKEGYIAEDAGVTTDGSPWRRQLAVAVASLYFCGYFFTTQRKYKGAVRQQRHHFVGSPHNAAVAKIMFVYLIETIQKLAQQSSKSVAEKERSAYQTTFKTACVIRLHTRIAERIRAASQGEIKTAGGTNLPACLNLYEEAKNKHKEFFDNMRKNGGLKDSKKSRPLVIKHDKGLSDGYKAGNEIGLDQQIDKREAQARLNG